jgi:hypothetical protein
VANRMHLAGAQALIQRACEMRRFLGASTNPTTPGALNA